ncbi:MAG: non-canonical purine NTP pyrophosphatase [Clostridia bacterium]|nr:non-canonical purine NTP pyrophosphatase [Clostridia bacterium]
MLELVLASHNKKKIAELQGLLADLGDNVRVLSLSDIGYDGGDIDEYGKTFEVNSLIKASVPAKMGYIGIADDSGLCVDALDGRPGVYSARYSAEVETDDRDAENRKKLLRELSGVKRESRSAKFVCVASLALPENSKFTIPEEFRSKDADALTACAPGACATVRGVTRGIIAFGEKGEGGFGYDSLFYSPVLGMNFAEATPEQKATVSHRGRAMREFVRLISMLAEQDK